MRGMRMKSSNTRDPPKRIPFRMTHCKMFVDVVLEATRYKIDLWNDKADFTPANKVLRKEGTI